VSMCRLLSLPLRYGDTSPRPSPTGLMLTHSLWSHGDLAPARRSHGSKWAGLVVGRFLPMCGMAASRVMTANSRASFGLPGKMQVKMSPLGEEDRGAKAAAFHDLADEPLSQFGLGQSIRSWRLIKLNLGHPFVEEYVLMAYAHR
jgi:hypothetical protein